MQNIFHVGVVENRNDPLKLGRVQVRVFGVHSESLNDIPVASLPWAICLGSIEGSISGIGRSTTYIEGTLVSLYFQDGESKQQPVIMGSIPGIPMSKGYWNSGGEQLENTTTVAAAQEATESPPTSQQSAAVLSSSTYKDKLKEALGFKESTNNYKAINQIGYIGKYQMGAAMLTDLGYVTRGTKNKHLSDPSVWTGKDGIKSREDFLNSPVVQESAMDVELEMNEKRLTKLAVLDENSTAQERAGFLATSHLLGTGGAKKLKSGVSGADANGVTASEYYNLGYKSVTGVSPTVLPENTVIENTARTPSPNGKIGAVSTVAQEKTQFGFEDPRGIFPVYIGEQDTNRLARNQNIGRTVVPIKESTLEKNVRIAGGGSWDQSPVPYNARYPYNNVYQSECGHIQEFDSTPGNERIHTYHSAGTFEEIDRNGTLVRKIVGDSYEIIDRNGHIYVKGNVNITVEGNANILVDNTCNLEVGGNLEAKIGGDANWSVGGDWKLKTGGSSNISSGDIVAMDGSEIHIQSGRSTAGSLTDPTKSTSAPTTFSKLTIPPRDFEALSEFESDELTPEEAEAIQEKLQAAGLIDEAIIDAKVKDPEEVKVVKNDTLPVECGMFKTGNIDINSFVSTNYKLKTLTRGENIVGQSGLQDTEIACNLKALATNILEPLKAKYPNMIITSCYRPVGSNAKSQHPKGQAVDLQFSGKASADYINIAKDLISFLPFDQLILEYRSNKRVNGEPTTWIHVSYNMNGNRGQVFTMNNDVRISNYSELKVVE